MISFACFLVLMDIFCEKAQDIIPTLRGVKYSNPCFTPACHILRLKKDFQVLCGCDDVRKLLFVNVDSNPLNEL